VVDLKGAVLEVFPSGKRGWQRALRWATAEGGELEVLFLEHVGKGDLI